MPFVIVIAALILVACNALKPLTVDDPAYLAYAEQIAAHPLDPYGFEVFWYQEPQPAFEVLAPPVLPYWLALGLRVVGPSTVALKLWLTPFALLLSLSIWLLARRFARSLAIELTILAVLSPTVLPGFNLMLDVPALALGLASVTLFWSAADRHSWAGGLLAGLLAGLAFQTKYTAITVPAVFVLITLTRPQPRPWACLGAALATTATVVIGWEALMAWRYGESHFLFHQRDPRGQHPRDGGVPSALLPLLGTLATPIALLALTGRAPRLGLVLASAYLGLLLIGWTTWVAALFGVGVLLTAVWTASELIVRRRSPIMIVLVGWLAIELAVYFAITPFPAARRIVGMMVLLLFLAGRHVARSCRWRPGHRRSVEWVMVLGIAVAGWLAAIDTLDAQAERWVALQAVERASGKGGRVWFVGHVGFGAYAHRAGARPLIPGERLLEGDHLIVPVAWPIAHAVARPPGCLKWLQEVVWEDGVGWQTVPGYYASRLPVQPLHGPRRAARVYRVRDECVAQAPRR